MGDPERWLVLLPLLPLCGALAIASAGEVLGPRGARWAGLAITLASGAAALVLGLALPADGALHQPLWIAAVLGSLRLRLALSLEPTSLPAVALFIGAALAAQVGALGASHPHARAVRDAAAINLALGAALLLELGDDLVLLLAGWQLGGAAIFVLLGGTFELPERRRLALQGLALDQLGAALILAGFGVLFWSLGGSWLSSPEGGSTYLAHPAFTPARPPLSSAQAASADPQVVPSVPDPEGAGRRLPVGPTLEFEELRAELATPSTGEEGHLNAQQFDGEPLALAVGLLLGAGLLLRLLQLSELLRFLRRARPTRGWAPPGIVGALLALTPARAGAKLWPALAMSPEAFRLTTAAAALVVFAPALLRAGRGELLKPLGSALQALGRFGSGFDSQALDRLPGVAARSVRTVGGMVAALDQQVLDPAGQALVQPPLRLGIWVLLGAALLGAAALHAS